MTPAQLKEISIEESLSREEVAFLWEQIPVGDMGDMSYLEEAAQCIIEVSNVIDDKYPQLSQDKRMAKKYRLMSKLLLIKSEQLEALE